MKVTVEDIIKEIERQQKKLCTEMTSDGADRLAILSMMVAYSNLVSFITRKILEGEDE